MFPNIPLLYVEILKLAVKSPLKGNYCAEFCNDRPNHAPLSTRSKYQNPVTEGTDLFEWATVLCPTGQVIF